MDDSKWVQGHEGIYSINIEGVIHSHRRSEFSRNKHGPMIRSRGGHPMKAFDGYRGYQQIELADKKKAKKYYVHRLVYQAYNGELIKGMVVHHMDHNKMNNHVSNLIQITYKEHSAIHNKKT